ncbi:MAG: ankyrin repeat domain-containing protein [Cyanobacteria bacterium P01_F01_bin.53]
MKIIFSFVAISCSLALGIAASCNRVTSSATPSEARSLSVPEIAISESPVPEPPPLIEATLAGDVDTVRSLLQSDADPNALYNTNTALTYAARDGFTEISQLLLDSGAEVNWIDAEGVTPLILAAFKDHPELAELLLVHGADATIVDQWNRTALDYALMRGEDDPIVQLLQGSL